MKTKKIPLRRCVGCGEMFDKRDLVRAVKRPDGEIRLDLTGKMAGRGAYVCKKAECLRLAQKKHALDRSLGVTVDDSVYEKMEDEICNAE